jgi:hypothetical protein
MAMNYTDISIKWLPNGTSDHVGFEKSRAAALRVAREAYKNGAIEVSLSGNNGLAWEVVKKPRGIITNPAPKRKTAARTQSAAESYVRRPSQVTKKKPTPRLKKRRTINLQSPRGVFPNPIDGDYESARKLFLFGSNDGGLYRQRTTAIIDNRAKKVAKGTFDQEKSLTLWKYWADDAAKRYGVEHGGKFSVADRKLAARMAADYYAEHIAEESVKFHKPVRKAAPKKNPVVRTGEKKTIVFVQSPGATAWKQLAVFAATMDGAQNALEYARAYHAKNPKLKIKVTG